MKTFPPEVRFQHSWRDYQRRVLDELSSHLEDGKLHVVAPPGSGKTVLGLEVIRRLDQPTLILSPTVVIRNQWIERLRGLFLPNSNEEPDWVSTDIRKPAFFTAATYQAVHSVMEKARTGLGKRLKKVGVGTLVLDEAHHLKNAWWHSLQALTKSLDRITTVAVTATPPYDVSYAEWQRYRQLCGPVDAEISVPELVQRSDLCCHQDYVHLCAPTPEEAGLIQAFRQRSAQFCQSLTGNPAFLEALDRHPWMTHPQDFTAQILDNPLYCSSMLVYLHHCGRPVPQDLVQMVSGGEQALPHMDQGWLEALLNGCLFQDRENFDADHPVMAPLRRRLKRIGAVDRRRVFLSSTPRLDRLMAASAAKLGSIVEIVRHEQQALGERLRLVVLADYIRPEALSQSREEGRSAAKMGVAPIFELLRSEMPQGIRLAVLTGSLVILPARAREQFCREASRAGFEAEAVRLSPLRHDADYLRVQIESAGRHRTVRLLTRLLEQGEITVLVGTASLLGEGWDAPAVNALILASSVGSYVSSNQMRGRAIRSLPEQPDKTANIWHLVCVDAGSSRAGKDFSRLRRRFKAFSGVSAQSAVIENGIARLSLPQPPISRDEIESHNRRTMRRAQARELLIRQWNSVFEASRSGVRMVEQLRTPTCSVGYTRGFHFRRTVYRLLRQSLLWAGGGALLAGSAPSLLPIDWIQPLGIGGLLISLLFLPGLVRSVGHLSRHGSPESSLRQMGIALLRALILCGRVRTPLQRLKVTSEKRPEGTVYCSLKGASTYETDLFLDSLQEMLDPIGNPRYLLVRESTWRGSFHSKRRQRAAAARRRFAAKVKTLLRTRQTVEEQRTSWLESLHVDYHAVPTVLGRKKKDALQLEKMWLRYVGTGKLVYTRNPAGRETLLAARMHSLSAAFQNKGERLTRWE